MYPFVLGSCRFQVYVEFLHETISLHKRFLRSHFYINIKSLLKFSKILSEFSIARYTKNLFFFLCFCIWKVFCWLFTFQSVCHVYLFVVQLFLLPVIFTSRILSNTEHRLEYFCYFVIRSDIFQAHFYHLSLS